MNTKYLSNFSIICFLLTFTLSRLVLDIPLLYSKQSGTATWLLSIYVLLLILFIFFIVSNLYEKFIGISIFDISKFVGGKILYFFTIILYSFAFILMAIFYLKETSETIQTLLFTNTSIYAISIILVITMVVTNIFGIEGIVRASGYLIPFAILAIILTLIFTLPFIKIDRFFPILGLGITNILKSGFSRIDSYLGFILLYFIQKYIKDSKTMKKISLIYIFTSFILITVTVVLNTLIFSYPYTSKNYYALYEIAKLTNLNSFFQRSEIIYIFALIIITLLFLITTFYATTYTISQILNSAKGNNNLITILTGIAVFCFSFIPINMSKSVDVSEILTNYFIIPITYIYPIFLLIISNIKAKIKRSEYEEFISNTN